MWMILLGVLLLGTACGIAYLSSRFAKFSFVQKAAKGRKWVGFAIGFAFVLAILLGTGAAFGAINAELCILHSVFFWLACDIISRIAKGKGRSGRRTKDALAEGAGTSQFKERKSRSGRRAKDALAEGTGGSKCKEGKQEKEYPRYYAGACALGITAAYLACGWYFAHHVTRTAYVLDTEKQVGSLRIVQIADSHVGNTFSGEGFLKHVQAIQSEHPDIVVVTGDFVDDDTSKEDMEAACEALGTLETTYGVYYAFGNHDKGYYGPEYRGYSGDDLIAELKENHVEALQDETVLFGGSFCLIGRQDRSESQKGGRASMEELMENIDAGKYTIVLDHQPHDYEAQAAAGVDLVLSGHTHGGQLFPFNHMGEWLGLDDKTYGLEQRGNTNFIVTSGISNWAIQFKTGCKAEYVVVDVQGNLS